MKIHSFNSKKKLAVAQRMSPSKGFLETNPKN